MPNGQDEPALPAGEVARGFAGRSDEEGVIERVEERAVVSRRVVDTGAVRVSTRTETVPEVLRDTLQDTAVEVERVPAGRFVEAAEGPRTEGDLTIFPVYEERLVVERRLWLVEEVHLRRVTRSHEVEETVELQRQVVEIERLPPLENGPEVHTPTKE